MILSHTNSNLTNKNTTKTTKQRIITNSQHKENYRKNKIAIFYIH